MVLLTAHLHALGGGGLVLVHCAQGLADAEEQHHELALGEVIVVDEVCVDHVLQVPPAVVGQQDIDSLAGVVARAAAAVRRHAVVVGRDDCGNVVEEAVGVDLAHGLLDGLGAEGASDLFEGEELVRGGVFDEVDVGEAALRFECFVSYICLSVYYCEETK